MTLNNIGVPLKGVLIDLRARNFVHVKIFLRARCAHARYRASNLSSPGYNRDKVLELMAKLITEL